VQVQNFIAEWKTEKIRRERGDRERVAAHTQAERGPPHESALRLATAGCCPAYWSEEEMTEICPLSSLFNWLMCACYH